MIVYIIINKITKAYYIGITNGNKKHYFGSGKALKDNISKYGKINFRKFNIEYCEDRIHASIREMYWIKYAKNKWESRKCLNLTSGGDNCYTRDESIGKRTSIKLKEFYKKNKSAVEKCRINGTKNFKKFRDENPNFGRKIYEKDIEYIKSQYDTYKKTLTELAKELNVSISLVGKYVDLKKRSNGSGNGQAKLKEPQVLEIREMYSTGNYLQREIGDVYGVGANIVSRIVNRKIWKHI